MSRVGILATGQFLVGAGCRSIDAVMQELIQESQNEIQLAIYLLTSKRIVNLLGDAASRGVMVTVVLNDFDGQPQQVKRRLLQLQDMFPHFRVFDFFEDTLGLLHAKVLVSDRKEAIVGSANFTRAGMSRNHEIAVYLYAVPAGKVAHLLDRLASHMKSGGGENEGRI